MNPFDLLEKRFYPAYQAILDKLPQIETYKPCSCCGRSAISFGMKGYQFKDSSKTLHTMCTPCTIINQQNADYMGFENGIIGYKLSSFKSAFLIIPLNDAEPMSLMVGGKYNDRLKPSQSLKIIDLSGHAAKAALLSDTRPKLVIENSLRREMWLRYLRFSSEKQLNIATELGCISVNHADYERLKTSVFAQDLKNSERKNLISQLRMQKLGLTKPNNPAFIKAMTMCSPELIEIIRETSQEPIGFLFMLDALSA